MAKLHFCSYFPKQLILFPQRIDENISENDPVRILDAIVDSLNLDSFRKLYNERGRSPFHPSMMLKVILYAYMNNINSCRKIEKLLLRDVHFIWLAAYEKPDFITINRFRNRVKKEINNIFTQVVLILASKGFITLDVEYIDGTKIESKANKYTFVWKKSVEKNRNKLMAKIARQSEPVEFTPSMQTDIIDELKESLDKSSALEDKEERKKQKERKQQIKQLEKHSDKLQEYDNHLEKLGERNSYSKTDEDATFMRMKEDAMNNGQTKPGYNLQIATENQFITNFALYHNSTDTLTFIPFEKLHFERYGRFPKQTSADSGYGSEENYRFMDDNGIEAFVKYNWFHKEQRPRYQPDPFQPQSLYYNKEQDYYVCPMGQHMERIGIKRGKTDRGYVTESVRCRAARCEGCPLRCLCFKGQGNRIIEVNHTLNEYKRQAKERL